MKRAIDALDASDWVLVGYVLGLLVVMTVELFDSDDSDGEEPNQSITLGEDHLRRVEDGDTLRVHRWHGHDLVLDGTLVIDADAVDGGGADG